MMICSRAEEAGMTEASDEWTQALSAYADKFSAAFRRRDQLRWLLTYVQGLIAGAGRKNIDTIARAAALPSEVKIEDAIQALRNFVNQSPWDEEQVWQRFREEMRPRFGGNDSTLVVDDVTFP